MRSSPGSACSRCSARQIEVTINRRSSDLLLRACRRCDLRQWEVDGHPAGLDSVLETLGPGHRTQRRRGGMMLSRHWAPTRP